MFSRLFSPLPISAKLTLKNRIVMAPMGTNYASPDGYITARSKLYYRTRARGGAGLIIVEAAHLDPAQRHRPNGIRISDDSFIAGLSELAAAIHENGPPAFQQLTHPGRLSSSKVTGITPVGASPIVHPVTGEISRPLAVAEILEFEKMFAGAARRAKTAGFDGVEIHGGHGYLLTEFVSPHTNKRTDSYGGSLCNRFRFPLEVVNKVRDAVGTDFLISFRLSATEFLPDGICLEEAKAFAAELEKAGVDLLHVSAGNNEQPATMAKTIPLSSSPPGCFARFAAAIREVVHVPVIAVGRIDLPDIAETILARNQADLVALGRALIADPYWPAKAKEGRVGAIHKCIACNTGCIGRLNQHKSISCVVNPWVGLDNELQSADDALCTKKRE